MNYMQAEFESILVKYGHDIWLQRRIESGATGTGNFIYSENLEIYTVRYTVTARQLLGSQEEEMEGILSTSERVYYFTIKAHPFDGDRIYEFDEVMDADHKHHTENNSHTVWSIDTSVPMRGVNGEIIYYVASATRIVPN